MAFACELLGHLNKTKQIPQSNFVSTSLPEVNHHGEKNKNLVYRAYKHQGQWCTPVFPLKVTTDLPLSESYYKASRIIQSGQKNPETAQKQRQHYTSKGTELLQFPRLLYI